MTFDESGRYYPVIFFDEFWLTREKMMEINSSLTDLNVTLSYSPLGLLRWQMMNQMEQSFKMQEAMGTSVEAESDEFKVSSIYLIYIIYNLYNLFTYI